MSKAFPNSARAVADDEPAPVARDGTTGEAGWGQIEGGYPAARAWLAVFDAGSLYRGWHPADVEWTLAEAHRLLRRLGGRVGPSGAKGYWPVMLEVEAEKSTRRRISAREVSTMHAAAGWVWLYLAGDDVERERRAVQRWAFSVEMGVSYTRFLREAGIVRRTEQERRQRGLMYLAAGLCRDSVRIPAEALVARLERARSEMRNDAPDELALAAQAGELPESPAPRMPHLPVIDGMWRDAELCRLLAPEARGPAVLSLLQERARFEAASGAIAETGPALSARVAQLRAEAVERGLIAADARQGGTLSREDLTARIERNREQSQ